MAGVNVFDQFDDPKPKAAPAAPAGPNAFDQFDEKPAAAAPPAADVSQTATPAAASVPKKPLLHQILDYAINENPAVGALELGGQAATGALSRIPAGFAGLVHAGTNAAGLTTGNPADTVTGVEHALTYQPRTDAAQEEGADIGATAAAGVHALAPVDRALGTAADATGHGPLIRSAVPAIADAVTNVLPLTKGLGAAAEAPGVVGAPSDLDPLATARAAGFKTSPTNASLRNPTMQPGVKAQIGEVASGGNDAITNANNIDNTARSTQLAGQQMGLGDNVTKITVPDLKTAKAAPGAAYDLTGQALGDFKPTSNMQNLLKDAASDNSVDSTSAARTAANKVLANIQDDGTYKGGGTQLVQDISSLRESPNTRPIANILEDEMDRQAQNSLSPTLAKNYRDARRQFAQIYTVQDALQGGQVDPQAIGAVHQAYPNLLTGQLRLIGSAAQELPADMKLPTSSDAGALDSLIGGTKKALGSIVRPIMRSDAVQTKLFGPQANAGGQSYFPTFGQAPEASAEPLKLALAPGSAGRVMPSEGGPHGAQIEAAVPPNARPLIDLQQPEGQVGRPTPVQGGMPLPEGPESISGAPPSSAGANNLIRPLGEAFQPHQPDLFPRNNVSLPKAAKSDKPDGITDADWKLLVSLGLGK